MRELQRALARDESTEPPQQRGEVPVGLSEREALLAEAERIAQLGSWVWNVGPDTVFWSDELFRILGFDPDTDQASTEAFFDRVHPDDRERVATTSQRGVETGISERVHFRVLRPDGTIRHVQMDGAMVFEPGGGLRRVVGTVLDQTDAIEAATSRARAENVLAVIEQLPDVGVVEVDATTGERRWSAGVRSILGLAPDAPADADTFMSRVHPDDRGLLAKARDETLDDGQPQHVDFRILLPSGERRYARGMGRPQRDADGNIVGLVSVVIDVTEQRRLEQRLAVAEKLEAIGRLAGGVAHDLNNLMMTVSTLGARLRPLAPAAADDLDGAVEAAKGLTHRLLSVSGQAPLDLRAVECNDLVRQAIDGTASALGDGIEVVTELCDSAGTIRVDARQIEQAMHNLLLNANDALGGRGRITVRTKLRDDTAVLITVEDDGAGMTDDVQARAFEPFFSTKGAGMGSGLGLSLVRGTVERHGGSVELTTRPAQGTSIAIALPRRNAALAPVATPASPVERACLRVLVVDDNDAVRGALRRMLEAQGHTVEEAALPSECLALATELSPSLDLLVSDLVMPEMLGPALVAELRSRRICPAHVIYVTGYGSSAQAMLEPSDIVLTKPFSSDHMREAIAALLSGRAAAPE